MLGQHIKTVVADILKIWYKSRFLLSLESAEALASQGLALLDGVTLLQLPRLHSSPSSPVLRPGSAVTDHVHAPLFL